MEKYLARVLLAAALLLAASGLGAQNVSDIARDAVEEMEGRGLLVRSNPAGAKVFIDGAERGLSPLSLNAIISGEHEILLTREGYRDRRLKVIVPAAGRLVVSLKMEAAAGRLALNIRPDREPPPGLPFAPVILADGVPAEDPLFELPVGFHSIQVRAFGWEAAEGPAERRVYVPQDRITVMDFLLKPAAFRIGGGRINRPRFNPYTAGSLGTAECLFEVSAPGRGVMAVVSRQGAAVYEAPLPPFAAWSQRALWNGRDAGGNVLPEGVYTIVIRGEGAAEAGVTPASGPGDSGPGERELRFEAEIDYSAGIYPLSLTGGVPGLFLVPHDGVLPAGSFQIEGSLFFGKTSERGRAFGSLPMEAGLRFSLFDRLELSFALEGVPEFGEGARFGFGASAKWMFFRAADLPLGLGAGFSCNWAEEEELTVESEGLSPYAALSFRLSPLFTLFFSPGLLWKTPGDGVPRLLLPAGILFRYSWFSAGLSLRPEIRFAEPDGGPFLFGGELKFNPPPSNMVYTLLGGLRLESGRPSGFGGAGIGIIY
ncbi:MAG: PEGA domain-containing protein [Treponema sp.]|jgi:hypothetical protein|nr:PEGA domain-containing protein [Treponema sp.]